MASIEQDIFRRGSTTYYWSSKFFPANVRNDVFKLYSFVRIADNFVDDQPAQPERLAALRHAWDQAWADHHFDATPTIADSVEQRVIKNIVFVARQYEYDPAWVNAFFDSMQADAAPRNYLTLDDTLWYIYGSAEVIGLMMAKILGLPEKSFEYAQLQGRAMQFINFLRDIEEDNGLGRLYIPVEDLQRFNLPNLNAESAHKNTESFIKLIHFELDRYEAWQAEATKGFAYIPRRLLIPLKTAVDMYNWTASEIRKDPFIIYKRKVKPRRRQIIIAAARSATK